MQMQILFISMKLLGKEEIIMVIRFHENNLSIYLLAPDYNDCIHQRQLLVILGGTQSTTMMMEK